MTDRTSSNNVSFFSLPIINLKGVAHHMYQSSQGAASEARKRVINTSSSDSELLRTSVHTGAPRVRNHAEQDWGPVQVKTSQNMWGMWSHVVQ